MLTSFWLIMTGENREIYACSSSWTTRQKYHYTRITLENNIGAFITLDGWQMTIWTGKLKTEHCIVVGCSYLLEFFNILAVGQKYFSFYPPSFFDIHGVINVEVSNFLVHYAGLYLNWTNSSLFIILGILPSLNLPRGSNILPRYILFLM